MVETLCDSGSVKLHAGANVSGDLTPANYTTLINEAEGDMFAETQVDWVNIFSSLNVNYSKVVEQACAAKAAIPATKFDMLSYNSVAEAMNVINTNLTIYDRAIKVLRDPEVIKAIGASLIDTS